jgi:hypothetical protein
MDVWYVLLQYPCEDYWRENGYYHSRQAAEEAAKRDISWCGWEGHRPARWAVAMGKPLPAVAGKV